MSAHGRKVPAGDKDKCKYFCQISALEQNRRSPSICRTSFPHFDDYTELLNYLLETSIRDEPEGRSVAVPFHRETQILDMPTGRHGQTCLQAGHFRPFSRCCATILVVYMSAPPSRNHTILHTLPLTQSKRCIP